MSKRLEAKIEREGINTQIIVPVDGKEVAFRFPFFSVQIKEEEKENAYDLLEQKITSSGLRTPSNREMAQLYKVINSRDFLAEPESISIRGATYGSVCVLFKKIAVQEQDGKRVRLPAGYHRCMCGECSSRLKIVPFWRNFSYPGIYHAYGVLK